MQRRNAYVSFFIPSLQPAFDDGRSLTARLSGPTEINLWHGAADMALQRQINLVFFSGGIPRGSQPYETQKNILFNLAGQRNVDGLLLWTNILSHSLDRAGLGAFCQRYAPLPIISMGMLLPSIPSIRIDMFEGARKLLVHLIEAHGRRRIAFIRGPQVSPDAQDRYRAYLETLKQYQLCVEPGLVATGDFGRASGTAAVQQLMGRAGMDFDAIVAANDNMALGALHALRERGIRVPEDVSVAGFDDIEETRAITPSLTTVRAPWYALGSKSVELVLSKLAKEAVPDASLLETELICRESCGCRRSVVHVHPPVLDVSVHPAAKHKQRAAAKSTQEALGRSRDEILGCIEAMHWLDLCKSKQLINAFFADVSARDATLTGFISTLIEMLAQITSGTEISDWRELLDLIQSKLDGFESEAQIAQAHQVLEQSYAILGEMAHRRQLAERLEAANETNRLNRLVQRMATTHDLEELMDLLALDLPELGIPRCFLSLYDEKGDEPAWSRLMLALVGGERRTLEKGGLRFPTRELVPPDLLPQDRCASFDVEALYFREQQIGFVVFQIGPRDGEVYSTLQGHISSALKSAELVQVALAAEAKAIKSDQLKTQLLANVSHELRAPLNIILGLSEMASASPSPYANELPAQLKKDLGYIYDSGEHLRRLINDLLDISRAEIGELDLAYEAVAPRLLLQEVFATFKKTSAGKLREVELILDIPDHLPILHADPIRLRQIFMNLLSNALKFTARGTIVLGADVQLPHIHFWVSDTGSGISPELQQRIFEPFVKADPAGRRREGIGLGLSITRRLVTLHGGSITLDSQPAHGAMFHVYLPLPGLGHISGEKVNIEGVPPLLLWISSNKMPTPFILNLCNKNGLVPSWLGSPEDFDLLDHQGKPAALAWDVENARPGDWAIIQTLRSYAQYNQLPLLLLQENVGGQRSADGRVTEVLLKPTGKEMIQQVLNLLPDAKPRGEIWIVDDDAQTRMYYQGLLGESLPEFRVRAVQGGKEALRLLEDATPVLVLLDLMMPEVDGFTVLEQLRHNLKTALIPVIILSGKILSYEDVKRLDAPKVLLETKGVLCDAETVSEIQRALTATTALPQPTSLLVKQSCAYIQQNYTRSFSLQELSATMGVSRSYLSRIFKTETGISLWDYLNRFRIQTAKQLLLLTDSSITEIALNVGYEDVGYFGRMFRQVTGRSPRAFRQQAIATATM